MEQPSPSSTSRAFNFLLVQLRFLILNTNSSSIPFFFRRHSLSRLSEAVCSSSYQKGIPQYWSFGGWLILPLVCSLKPLSLRSLHVDTWSSMSFKLYATVLSCGLLWMNWDFLVKPLPTAPCLDSFYHFSPTSHLARDSLRHMSLFLFRYI